LAAFFISISGSLLDLLPTCQSSTMLQELLNRWIRPSAGSDSEGLARKKAFADVYAGKLWGNCESVSGPGSGVARASLFRADFERLLQELSIRAVLDAGCGDFNWLPTFDLRGIRVVGVDIVPELISVNRLRHPAFRFELADIVVDPLPKADLILCRDGLVHLSNTDIVKALGNFRRSGAKWLLTNTFVDRGENLDILSGSWRPLNLRSPPFALPAPYRIIDEHCLGYEGAYRDKRLAVWPCDQLPHGQ
jgi:SAM-dependent methyltransferase